MFKLGKHFRERYANFLTYNPKEVHLRSSDADRCLESAALVMAGLYPPQERWNWSKDLNWQPFPIHTVPKNEDGVGVLNCLFFILIFFYSFFSCSFLCLIVLKQFKKDQE